MNRFWQPVVKALVKAGKVEKYPPQYNMRHTFVTLALKNDVKDNDVVGHLV
ncbi:hypothetical protein [Chroococcidiopsis sp. SAG 2025]|uniref:hypothetical protein n=1 Tax=Chroococcidiopsis sp. SAG 2025 TaxID=171389 RepID=UPI002937211E|nr:hypothetical protein [Chroococcidiopsis sp. SAG 2025]